MPMTGIVPSEENYLTVSMAPSVAMGMTYVAAAGSIGIVLNNAANNQEQGQTLANATVSICCGLIVKASGSG